MITHSLFSVFFLFSLLSVRHDANALTVSQDYEFGPISLSAEADFFYTIDRQTSTASFAVVVNDTAIVTDSANWIGVGISEPTSGSMLGADVVTAEFSSGDTAECEFTDRYVPFYAFPLIESTADAPSAFPLPDDCQQDGSWTLISCMRSPEDGQMILEVSRPLEAHDDQDRAIPPGPNSVIYSYGSTFAYHGARRSSTRIILYEEDGTPDAGMDEEQLPDDVDGSIDVTATAWTVPSDKVTTYACTSQLVQLDPGEQRMIVAAEPILNATDNAMVHHLTFWLCRSEEYAELTRTTVECGTGNSEIPGPQGSSLAQCATFIYAYVKGMKRLVLPEEAGILMDSENYILVLETHYDNPEQIPDTLDSSGVRLYYTNTMRQYEAGSLLMGDILINRFDDVVENGFEYEHTCTSACTNKFSRPINYYASFLHMHTTGMEIYNNKFSENGSFVENMNKVNFWSDSFQNYIVFDPPKQIRPGDQLQVTCLYDTRKRPNTTFGLETKNEMCMEFAAYWPVQRDPVTNEKINVCAYFNDREQNATGTFCGDLGNITESSIIIEPNPAFEDKQGAPTDFGKAQPTCAPMQPLAPVTTSPTTTVGNGTTDVVDADAEATADDDDDDDDVCFPASATVQLADGSKKRMDELQIGDGVLVGREQYSDVFMFTHRSAQVAYQFVQLTTSGGKRLKLTRGHFLYLDGQLRMASSARRGDRVWVDSGAEEVVVDVAMVREKGLYNPQTIDGNVVVDGVLCSTYTHTIVPRVAHSLLAPLRVLYSLIGSIMMAAASHGEAEL